MKSMTSSPLPPSLGDAFSVRDAIEQGASPGMLRRVELRTPHRGVRARGADPTDLRGRCREYAPRLRPGQFFSHETALALIGCPLPPHPYLPAVHVSTHRPAYPPRLDGVVPHRLQTRENATETDPTGIALEHPGRAWRQCGTLWRLHDLVAAADFLISGPHPLLSIDELREEIALMGDTRRGILTRALDLARVGPRSPRETELRLLLVRAGLPEPLLTWNLFDERGIFIAELDMAYPDWRVCPEYDGRVHAENARQFARDADRWAAIRRAGWEHVRILSHHMSGDGRAAVALVREALINAGWRPHR